MPCAAKQDHFVMVKHQQEHPYHQRLVERVFGPKRFSQLQAGKVVTIGQDTGVDRSGVLWIRGEARCWRLHNIVGAGVSYTARGQFMAALVRSTQVIPDLFARMHADAGRSYNYD